MADPLQTANSVSICEKQYAETIQVFDLSNEKEWVSEWLIALHQFSNFSAISWREQVNFQWNDDEDSFVLDQHDELILYSARSLKQQYVVSHVA